jgi:hypothetical protein
MQLKYLQAAEILIQGCKKPQGTTSVVPQMANLDSGFSYCGIANY